MRSLKKNRNLGFHQPANNKVLVCKELALSHRITREYSQRLKSSWGPENKSSMVDLQQMQLVLA
ncbi:MAG: hypothetical protein U0892_19200 [Pirellulales bacterium]